MIWLMMWQKQLNHKEKTDMDLSKLKEPFSLEDIEWRLQHCGESKDVRIWGKCLAYITSRAVQERLDEVCGVDGWKSEIRKDGNAYLCTLSIKVTHEDGSIEWISRTDGADSTDIESVKGGISGAIKRAAVQFGIGRYLYDLEEGWITVCENGRYFGKTKNDKSFKWNPPTLPEWALPKDESSFPEKAEKVDVQTVDSLPKTHSSSKGKTTTKEENLKEMGNTVISRIGDVMNHENDGHKSFTEEEISKIRGIVANTRLNKEGVDELLELEKVVQEELEARLSKMAA